MKSSEIESVINMADELSHIMHRLEEEHKEPGVRKRLDTIIGKLENLVYAAERED